MFSCGLKAGMETPAPLVTSIINNAVNKPVIYSSPHQSDAASNHSHPALLSGRLLHWIMPQIL